MSILNSENSQAKITVCEEKSKGTESMKSRLRHAEYPKVPTSSKNVIKRKHKGWRGHTQRSQRNIFYN